MHVHGIVPGYLFSEIAFYLFIPLHYNGYNLGNTGNFNLEYHVHDMDVGFPFCCQMFE